MPYLFAYYAIKRKVSEFVNWLIFILAAADLQLGLATAPVLFAAQKFPELNSLIERRFSEAGDVVKALDWVHKSDGLEETKFLAQKYCVEAVRYANNFKSSPFQKELVSLTEKVLNRTK